MAEDSVYLRDVPSRVGLLVAEDLGFVISEEARVA